MAQVRVYFEFALMYRQFLGLSILDSCSSGTCYRGFAFVFLTR